MHFDFTIGWSTIAEIGTLCTIAGFGWKFLKLAKEGSDKLGVIFWEHKVMWEDWRSKNDVPTYPRLRNDL